MVDPPEPVDPWDTSGLPFTRVAPVYAGVGAGAAIAVVWLLADRPAFSVTTILVVAGTLAGGIAATLAPSGRRSTRFLDVAYPALVAGVATRFFGAIGEIVTGNDDGQAPGTAFAYFFVLAFFVGFPVLVAKVFQNPSRRLPDAVLDQIEEPYPTRRAPKLVTVRVADGTTHRISVLRGGFIAGVKVPFDVAAVTGVVRDDKFPSGPRRSGGRRARSAKSGEEQPASPDSPAPTSRTTPKGTPGNRKRPKR